MPGVRGKLRAICLIFGHGADIDRGERFAGGAREIGWSVVSGDAAATLCDWLELRLSIGAPVGKLIRSMVYRRNNVYIRSS